MTLRDGLALAACLTACLAWPARAGERAGVSLPEKATVEGRTLILNGMGLRKATWLRVKVSVAGLYLEEKSLDAEDILRRVFPVGRDPRVAARFRQVVG